MAGRHPYSELREKLSAEAQARAAAKAAEMREEMDLARLRRTRQFSQQELAKMLEVGQTAIAKLERRGDMYVSTLRRFVEAMGGELRISARFPEGDFDLLPSEEDRRPVVSQFYEWVRFWCPRSGKRDLSDDGFLTNPESDLGEILNADLVPFSRISSTSCLVLLGQPGIGKSVAMRADFEHWRRQTESTNNLIDYIDLRSFSSETRLEQRLFHSEVFATWLSGKQKLHLFIDSVDEALLRIDTLAALLGEELRKYPIDRLSLRIACRTAVWPELLERELATMWSGAQLAVYELAPLRRLDVERAASINRIDPTEFVEAVIKAKAQAFAILPVTLNMLLNIYRREGHLPKDRWELYEKGTTLLADETSLSRRAARLTGRLTAQQRLAVASRVAALTIFANRFAVWTEPDKGDVPDEDLTKTVLAGGQETVDGNAIPVQAHEIDEAVETGLFSSRGPGRMGWTHQTYAEFLASRYVLDHGLSVEQLLSIVLHPVHRKVVPQLYEVTAWLATKLPGLFEAIVPLDPAVLLSSDIATEDVTSREKLTASLLSALDEGRLHDIWAEFTTQYHTLAHPGLAPQLLPFITDRSKGIIVRRVAILIARACSVAALGNALLGVALDAKEDAAVRSLAILALDACGNDSQKLALKPLALYPNPDDKDDDIKGSALSILWPRYISSSELFSSLTPKKKPNVGTTYTSFILVRIHPHLQPADLPAALRWVQTLPAQMQTMGHFEAAALADRIVLLGVVNFSGSGVLAPLATVLANRLKQHFYAIYPQYSKTISAALETDVDARRSIAEAVTALLDAHPYDAAQVATLLRRDDLQWLIDRSMQTSALDVTLSEKLAAVAAALPFDYSNRRAFEIVFEAASKSEAIKKEFAWLLGTVDLASPLAEQLRSSFRASRPIAKKSPQPIVPSPAERVAQCLAEFENGDVNGWWHLCLQLTLDPEGLSHGSELESDLTTLPGWRSADEPTRKRILQCAAAYLPNGESDTKNWLGTGNLHRPALAGYKALCLLQREAPSLFLSLNSNVWARWAAVVITYYFSNEKEDLPVWRELVRITLDQAPKALVQTLGLLIEHEARNPREVSWLRIYLPKLSDCFDNELFKNLLLEEARNQVALPQHVTSILQELLKRRFRPAFEFACGLIEAPAPLDRSERERSIAAAEALIVSGNSAAWPHLWSAFQTDEDLANRALKAAANSAFVLEYTTIFAALDERSLADLFAWLEKRYPHKIPREEEEFSEAGHVVGPLDRVAQFRDAALMTLRGRGTLAAVTEMKRIRDQLPHLDFLRIAALDTEKLALARTWRAPKPKEFLELVRKSEARFVANADELLTVVCESLQRLEKEEFRNEASLAPGFWDKASNGRFRPKDEPTIANEIARYLDRDLKRRQIIVNREVEVHRPLGAAKGPTTDIHIDTTIQGSGTDDTDRLKIAVEVKGCWNAELKTAMKDQLLGKYLLTPDCSRGIYLVAWFDRGLWDSRDRRRRTAGAWSVQTAKEFFDEQAQTLSDSDHVVRAVILDCNPVTRKAPQPNKRKVSPSAKTARSAHRSASSGS